MKFYTDETLNAFKNEVLDLGFTEDLLGYWVKRSGTKELGGVLMTVNFDDEFVKVKVEDRHGSLTSTYGNLEEALAEVVKRNAESFPSDNTIARDPENIRAARLIHEVRTLNLGPNDKLVVIVSDDVDSEGMEICAKAMQRWVGDKGAHRVMVMKKAELIKVTDEHA